VAARGLFARIGRPRHGPPDDPSSQVLEHLRVLLNARQGESEAAPDFGIGDTTEVTWDALRGPESLRRDLQRVIERYEPRLARVRVRHVPQEGALLLRFEIEAELRTPTGPRALRLETELLPSGEIRVQ
jgi:type VI secretion system protein